MRRAVVTSMVTMKSTGSDWHPWTKHNLSRNPFGELTRQERAEIAVVDITVISDFISRRSSAVQLLGDCGRGKTTRMLALESTFPDATYVYLPEDGPCPPIADGDPVLIDEAQRLPRAALRRVLETGVPVVLATHRDLSRRLRRFEYRVHTESIGEGNSPSLICELLNRRIEASRLHAGAVPTLSLADAELLSNRFGTDIRQIESFLYERAQTQVAENGEMRFVD